MGGSEFSWWGLLDATAMAGGSLFGSQRSAGMREGGVSCSLNLTVRVVVLLLHCLHECSCKSMHYLKGSITVNIESDATLPEISPSGAPQPFLPLLAPSPLTPFTNNSVPKLSGLCTLNFTAAESMMSMTSIDCWSAFAPYLANVLCCPQLEAILVILIGQHSKTSNLLALNGTLAKPCLSDVEQILLGQGASSNLQQICSIHASNLTEATCPVKDVNEFEGMVDSSKLLSACEKIDPVKECCDQICQSAILEASRKIALKPYDLLSVDGSHVLPDRSAMIDDCRSIVLRWLASRLSPSRAKEVLRGLSNCNVNKACPLLFPNISHVTVGCGNGISNQTACCNAMDSYMSYLQRQSFITNLQALNCAASLRMKLQKENITKNVYSLCHISLKDFSVQAATEATSGLESGCLLPSLPSDAILDKSLGVSFLCDLNDNIPAPWPTTSQLPASTCKKTVKIPALPAVASAQSGLYNGDMLFSVLFTSSTALLMLL
ncbi:uncharacterized GPI-anchored protein At1g61900 [Malania oleifera]|uniref:uncharacterized GPI-anchored protein At1g61900 n=1 Tax=Malania oleifera TaxID=397392 RepID=UPI0025AE501D|nr:uncharacterized GPI-anchored protein At1g61900 [Malania oleifera]